MCAGRECLETLERLQGRVGKQLQAVLRQLEGRSGRGVAGMMLLAMLHGSAGRMEGLRQAVSGGPPRPMGDATGDLGVACRRWRRLLARWRRALHGLADDNELDVRLAVGGRRASVGECIAQAVLEQARLAGRLEASAHVGRPRPRPHRPLRPVGKSIGPAAPAAATMRPCAGLRAS